MTSIYPSSTSSSSTSSKNLLRISGMASGIDTDSVVKSMVSNYQAKIDKANQAKQTLQWKQDAYRDIIKGIKGLQDYFNVTSSKYILGGDAMNINTGTSDKTSVVSATVGTTAQAGTYGVSVTQMAEQAKATGTSLDSMVDVTGITDLSKVNLSLNIGTKTIGLSIASNATGSDAVASINSQIAAEAAKDSSLSGVSASYVSDGTNSYIKFTKSSTNTSTINLTATNSEKSPATNIALSDTINSGISASTKLSDLSINSDMNFKVNGTTVNFTYKSTSTVQDLMNTVSSATSGAVTISVDDNTGKISFQTKSYGSTASIKIENGSTAIIQKLGLSSDETVTSFTGIPGKDAIVDITSPGQTQATTTTQSSNQFTINGVSYNLVNKGVANVTVTANTDNVVKNFKSFIQDYNTIVSTINTKLTEKKNKDYAPLTDDQKSAMSESQIKAWEDKAKVGVLRNDDYLNDLMTQVRGIFSSSVYSSYSSSSPTTGKISLSLGQYGSSAVGIDTSSDVADGGKLVLKDETKLTNAIKNNFDDFKKLFSGASSTSLVKDASGNEEAYIGSKKYMEDGIFTRMNTMLRDYVAAPGLGTDGTYTLSGSMNIFVNKQYDFSSSGTSGKNTLPDQVYNKTLSVSKLKTQMSDAETRYYAKFTALETAMTKLNSQQSQLSSMLGTA